MSGGLEQRDDISIALVGAVILHAVVGAGLILFAPRAETKLVVNAVPVNIVASVPDSAPEIGLPEPLPSPPAEVLPAPPEPTPPEPPPPPKNAAPPVSPLGQKPPPKKPPPPRREQQIDADQMLEDLANDTRLRPRDRPPTKPASPPRRPPGPVGSPNPGPPSAGAIQSALGAIRDQVIPKWNLDCAAPNLAAVKPSIRLTLDEKGRLVGEPQIVGAANADSRRALAAVKAAAPFRDVPNIEQIAGRTFTAKFNALEACRRQ